MVYIIYAGGIAWRISERVWDKYPMHTSKPMFMSMFVSMFESPLLFILCMNMKMDMDKGMDMDTDMDKDTEMDMNIKRFGSQISEVGNKFIRYLT